MQVFESNRHVIADPGSNHLRIRVLQHHAHHTRHGEFPGEIAVVAAKHPGDGGQER